MIKEKLTSKDRKSIVARVKSGEKQVDVARDFGITQGYLSKIVKQSKINSTEIESFAKPVDLSDKTADQLRNRYRHIHMELLRHNDELDQRLREADALHQSIESESAKPDDVRDEGWILAQKKRLTWCQDTSRKLRTRWQRFIKRLLRSYKLLRNRIYLCQSVCRFRMD